MPRESIRLGLMPPLSGVVGIYGPEIARAGRIACQEVNERGGVLGRPLELVVEDDGSLPESAVAAAHRLVHAHRCSALVGNLLSNSRIAVAYQVAEPCRLPYLNFSFYEGSILSRYFFHFAALPNQQIERMIPCMRARFGPRMFFAGNNYEWPRGSIDAAKRALVRDGGEIAGEEYCPIGVSPAAIDRLLDQVEAAAPDVFVPYFAGDDQIRLLTRFTERGLKRRIAVVMGHYDEAMASRLPPPVREGFYSSNTYFMSVDSPENRRFLARLAAWPEVDGLWPPGSGLLTNFGEGAYLCVQAFAQAANQAGSVDGEALVDALAHIELAGLQGKVRMDPATHHAQVNTYLARCDADGRFALVESFGPIEPVLPERYRHLQVCAGAMSDEDMRLQARMLEQMSDAVFLLTSGDARIVYANPGAERLFGYPPGELIGRHISVLNAAAEAPEATAAGILDHLARKGSWEGEIENRRKDGTAFWTSASVSAFTHPVHGEVWLSVQKDITQLKRLQAELEGNRQRLETLVDQLQAANQELESFSYAASHDMKAPLGRINSFCALLRRKYGDRLDGDGTVFLDLIQQNASRLHLLVDDLLAHAQIGQQPLDLQPVSLPAAIRGILHERAEEIRHLGAEMHLELPDGISVRSHPVALAQVLRNLLDNALKYSAKSARPIVTIGAGEHGGRCRVWVRDNGIGIGKDYHASIFEIFRRLHTYGEYPGSGVGLALVKKAVERMDGRVWVESEPGEGATFFLDLPV